jgi:mRNA interferase MazF
MFKKGFIVLIPFPCTDLSATKVRPAVIVSDRKIGDDIIVAFISSQQKRRPAQFDIVVKHAQPGFAATGLKTDSMINVSKLATLDKKIVLGELGRVDSALKNMIDMKLRLLFGL